MNTAQGQQGAKFEYYVEHLRFSSGTEFVLDSNDVLVIVGSNNSGKSEALRNLRDALTMPRGLNPNMPVLPGVTMHVSREPERIESFLDALDTVPTMPGTVGRLGTHASREVLLKHASDQEFLRRNFAAFCARSVDTISRLQAADPARSFNPLSEHKSHPLQYLYDDDEVQERLGKHFRRAFGTDLTLNLRSGSEIACHVGPKPTLQSGENPVSTSYVQRLQQLPLLNKQGDGMRSFMGCLLWATVVDYNMVLIDEPGAFLHPPQARLIGTILAREKPKGQQLFLATHSGDLLSHTARR